MSVRFEKANARDFTDEDVFGPDSPGAEAKELNYTPYYDRTDLNPEEQAMWDDLVREEMNKLEGEFQQQAMLGATLNDAATAEQIERQELAMLALAQQPSQEMPRSGSHHFIPDPSLLQPPVASKYHSRLQATTPISSVKPPVSVSMSAEAELKMLNAPVTILTAKRQKAPTAEPLHVPPTILSGIGATARRAERQKLQKREEFKRLVAADGEMRRRTSDEDTSGGRHLPVSQEERERAVDDMISDEYSYSSRWDNLGNKGALSPNSMREEALLRKRQHQLEYAQLLKVQQEEKFNNNRSANDLLLAQTSLMLPTEVSPYQPQLNDGKTRHVSRFSSSSSGGPHDASFEDKRRKQIEYHEQLAKQITFAASAATTATATATSAASQDRAPTTKRSLTAPVEPGASLMDTIGSTERQRQDTALKRQQQLQYHQDLALAATQTAIPNERISLRDKYRTIAKATEENHSFREEQEVSIRGIGGHAASLDKARLAQVKREQQQEYARQIQEASSKAPLRSPRATLHKHTLADERSGVNRDREREREREQGAAALLANGLATMGPTTTVMLKRAQQELWKQTLDRDLGSRVDGGGGGGGGERREPRRRPEPEPPQSTGLFVGPDIGAATRHSLQQRKQEEYVRELAMDKNKQPIPTIHVPRQKPPSACSPRPGDDDYGYFAVGTSIQVGAPTAVAAERERDKKQSYQQQLDADLTGAGGGGGVGAGRRRASPQRRTAYPESAEPVHNTLQLHNPADVETALAIQQRIMEKQRYISQLEESRHMQPLALDRISLKEAQMLQGGGGGPGPGPGPGTGAAGGSTISRGIQRRATAQDYAGLKASEQAWW